MTFEDIEAAIMVSDGYISRISEYLGISIHMVKKHMEKFPTLGRLMQDHREKKTDGAEKVIEDKMADGNLLAAIFYLKCHGKDRGWIERAEQQRQGPAKIEVTIRPAKGVQHQPVTTSIDAEFVDVTAQEGQGKAEKERSGKLLFLPQPK